MIARPSRKAAQTADFPIPRKLSDAIVSEFETLLFREVRYDHRIAYLASTWMSKYVDPLEKEGSANRRARAIEKWLAAEAVNAITNERLFDLTLDDEIVFENVTVERLFIQVRREVFRVVGNTPNLDIALGGFSGGATTSKKRTQGHPALKFRDEADATPEAWVEFHRRLDADDAWARHMHDTGRCGRVVRGNVLFTVPKSSDIDRVACKEPDINVFMQKGLGDQLRRKLRTRAGINLNDQRINQRLARRGSLNGSLATLDLSSASDSVTTAFVMRAVPTDWYDALDTVRSRKTEIDGNWHTCQMFSSMGNGFTFELESLLFFALAKSVAYLLKIKGTISVYGDDLIVPVDMVEPFIMALKYCGFTTNESKSFWSGEFRESCGAHWRNGIDVTPFYLRGPITRLSDLILFLNNVTEHGTRDLGVLDYRYYDFLLKWREHVPKSLWGGQRFGSRNALVTGDRPRKELKFLTDERQHRHIGGYLSWLHGTLTRTTGKPYVLNGDRCFWLREFRRDPKGYTTMECLETSSGSQTSEFDAVERPTFARKRKSHDLVNTDLPYFPDYRQVSGE